MKISWLQILNAIAKTGNRQITAKYLSVSPALVHSIVRRVEKRWGLVLFHRTPWTNQTRERLWEVADDRARIIMRYIDAILHEMTLAEENAFIVHRHDADKETRWLLRTSDIKKALALEGNSVSMAAKILGISRPSIEISLAKVERWLGIQLYTDWQSGYENLKVLTKDGERVRPNLARIDSYFEEILGLTKGE